MIERRQNGNGTVVADVVKGAIAGAVATRTMDKVTWYMWHRQDGDSVRREEHEARREGVDPAHVTANRVARAAGMQLNP